MNANLFQNYECGETINPHLRVRVDSIGKLAVATAALTAEVIGHVPYGIGITTDAQRKMCTVYAKLPGLKYLAVAAGAITLGAEFKANDGGKIQACSTGLAEGRVLKAAANDGDIIEVVYYPVPITRG